MKKLFSKAPDSVYLIITAVATVFVIMGYIHSWKQHSLLDLALTIFIPPFAFYRGIESLWH